MQSRRIIRLPLAHQAAGTSGMVFECKLPRSCCTDCPQRHRFSRFAGKYLQFQRWFLGFGPAEPTSAALGHNRRRCIDFSFIRRCCNRDASPSHRLRRRHSPTFLIEHSLPRSFPEFFHPPSRGGIHPPSLKAGL